MPDFTITVTADDAAIIQKHAAQTSHTPRELVELQIHNWTEGLIKGYFWGKVRDMTTEDLKTLLGNIE
jgi:hypothetical protein